MNYPVRGQITLYRSGDGVFLRCQILEVHFNDVTSAGNSDQLYFTIRLSDKRIKQTTIKRLYRYPERFEYSTCSSFHSSKKGE
jgi:hypothetical protein